jgi:hypothetical protein
MTFPQKIKRDLEEQITFDHRMENVNIRLTRYDVTIFVNEAVGIELTCFL